ncbi:MAG: hypothetical protein JWR21_883 [Herminiimonas sp.]|nr:hypothetical protein [Herminiimonas sp.]
MPTLRNKVANALSFAHLAGFGSRKAEGDEPEKKDGKAKGSRADDQDEADDKRDDQDREDIDSKKSKKAEGDDPDKKDDDDAEGDGQDDGDDEEEGDKKAKKAKAEDDDPDAEDDEDEMRGKGAASSARRRERARCAAIFGSKAAGRNPVLAANLAFKTSMTRKQALAVLEGTPAAATGGDRASRNPGLGAGGSSQPSSRQAAVSSWDAAFAKVNPRRK